MESEQTRIFKVPVPMVNTAPSACCCTLRTGFSGVHCAYKSPGYQQQQTAINKSRNDRGRVLINFQIEFRGRNRLIFLWVASSLRVRKIAPRRISSTKSIRYQHFRTGTTGWATLARLSVKRGPPCVRPRKERWRAREQPRPRRRLAVRRYSRLGAQSGPGGACHPLSRYAPPLPNPRIAS